MDVSGRGDGQAQSGVAIDESKTVEAVKVSSVKCRLLPRDPRKISWLWEVDSVLALRFKPTPESPGGFASTHLVKSLVYCVPNGPAGECWRDIVDPLKGRKTHTHYGLSEWNGEFRRTIDGEWLRFFRGSRTVREGLGGVGRCGAEGLNRQGEAATC